MLALTSSTTTIALVQAREQSVVTCNQGFKEWLKVLAESAKTDPLAKMVFKIQMSKSVEPIPTLENEGTRIKIITSKSREQIYTLEDDLELKDEKDLESIQKFFLNEPIRKISEFVTDGLDFTIMLDVCAYSMNGRCFAPLSRSVTFSREGMEAPEAIEMVNEAKD